VAGGVGGKSRFWQKNSKTNKRKKNAYTKTIKDITARLSKQNPRGIGRETKGVDDVTDALYWFPSDLDGQGEEGGASKRNLVFRLSNKNDPDHVWGGQIVKR